MENYNFTSNRGRGRFVERLTKEAVIKATDATQDGFATFTAVGQIHLRRSKDLSQIKYIIEPAGRLTRLPNRVHIMESIALHNETGLLLFPGTDAKILVDNDYIMASLGVLSKRYKEAAVRFWRKA